MAAYAIGIWTASGLIQQQWWIQFACFIVSTYLMVELNNVNALIRIYSRMVSSAFLGLSCAACFLFPSVSGAIAQLGFIATLVLLFHTYQDRRATGWTFYAFLLLSLSSFVFVQMFYFVPLVWLLMGAYLQSLSWRTFSASLLGLLTPYWFAACYWVYQADFTRFADHFVQLGATPFPPDFSAIPTTHWMALAFTVVLALTGIIHYLRTSYNDKIRIRMLYACFIWLLLFTLLFLGLQPQHYDILMRILTVVTAPLIAHFIALTRTRWTNMAFIAFVVVALLITAYSLWTSL